MKHKDVIKGNHGFKVGERVAHTGVKGGLWGTITETKKASITIACDNGKTFVARYGGGGFGLVRHGDKILSTIYLDPHHEQKNL